MIQPKCSICGKDLIDNDGYVLEGEARSSKQVLKEEQVKYWMHNPKNIHTDVEVKSHKDCFDKVKAVYKDFDNPVEDYTTCKYPTLDKDGKIVLKTPEVYKSDMDKIIEEEKQVKAIK